MYDYFLDGSHNFATDRELAAKAMAVFPGTARGAREPGVPAPRRTALAHLGIDQFVDLGSGIPTSGNVHEIAFAANPEARTVYVDSDAVATTHARLLLDGHPHARVIHADPRSPGDILENPILTDHLDLGRAIAVLLVSVPPFIPNADDPAGIVEAYRDACVPGSYLAISRRTNGYQPAAVRTVEGVYTQTTQPGVFRSRAQIAAPRPGYELLAPGPSTSSTGSRIRTTPAPDPLGGDAARYSVLAAVGRRD